MDNETTLEAILVNQNQKADETINALETLITQNENNNTESILEAHLVIQNDILEAQKELIKTIREKENEPIEIKFEIVGGEAELVEEDTEEDNESTDEEND